MPVVPYRHVAACQSSSCRSGDQRALEQCKTCGPTNKARVERMKISFAGSDTKIVDNAHIPRRYYAEHRSSSGPTIYTAVLWQDGGTSCNCPGWQNRKKCKHADAALDLMANQLIARHVSEPPAPSAPPPDAVRYAPAIEQATRDAAKTGTAQAVYAWPSTGACTILPASLPPPDLARKIHVAKPPEGMKPVAKAPRRRLTFGGDL